MAGSKDVAELLIAKGADVNAKNNMQHTPLHEAAKPGNKEVVQLLLAKGAKGAEVHASDLNVARDDKHDDVVRLLSHPGFEEDPQIKSLVDAFDKNDLPTVTRLLENDPALVSATDEEGYTALDRAATGGRVELAKLLVARGANVNGPDGKGDTPLYKAASSVFSDIETVQFFLAKGANVNVEDKLGRTPLHGAAANLGSKGMMELLLAQGANVNATDALKVERRCTRL